MKTLREALIASYEKRDGHSLKHTHPEHADAALSALRQWLAYEGLVVVPRDPSDAMAEAGWSVRGTQFEPTPDAQEIYRAMIVAAPDALREGE